MSEFKGFTAEEVRRIDRVMSEGRAYDTTGLSPELARILREGRSTMEDVERASEAAYRAFLRCLEDMRLHQSLSLPTPIEATLRDHHPLPIQ